MNSIGALNKVKNNEAVVRKFLKDLGYQDKEIKNYLRVFNLNLPAYEQLLEEGDIIYQFMRVPTAKYPEPKLGNWFSLFGSNMTRLGIFSGAGRILAKVKVQNPITVLEGTAAELPLSWKNNKETGEAFGVGGKGGATQIFIPAHQINSSLIVLGYLNEIPAMDNDDEAWMTNNLPA